MTALYLMEIVSIAGLFDADDMTRNVSLRHLRCFIEVANTGSFTEASSRLFVTQSSLTATIQQFEEAVGLKLFDRTTRRVVLTQEGLRFKPEAGKILREFDNAIDDLEAHAQSQMGHIRIAAAPSVIYQFLVHAISKFREEYPNVTVSLRDAGAEHAERMVTDGEVDFAVTSKHQGFKDLEYVPLLEDRYGVVCRADHPLARLEPPLRWQDLPVQDYVAFSPDTGVGSFLKKHDAGWPALQGPHDEISSTTSLYPVLRAWNKFSILPALAGQFAEFPDLRFIELGEPALSREVCLITRRLRSLSPTARRILDVLFATLEEQELPPGVLAIKR
jgi:DNA-binding transcriptional LysR family regulator